MKNLYRNIFKRLFDIVIAILTLPVQMLVFLILAPAIYLEDKGPIFYLSKRRGRGGEIFTIYKYRSMFVNAPDIRNADNSAFTGPNDSRVTKVGRFIRKTSLDELPQFWNVLKGDMSVIGPRPNLTKKPLAEFSELERKRITIRPGITGYNQAYFRNSITQEEKYRNDCYYVDHISCLFDCKIFFMTIISVLRQKNINASV